MPIGLGVLMIASLWVAILFFFLWDTDFIEIRQATYSCPLLHWGWV
jgi:hypothetical protein